MSDISENVVGIRLFMWYSVFIKGRELSIPSSRSSASESRKRVLLICEQRVRGNKKGYDLCMRTREEVLAYCMTFQDVYRDAPFHDDNWQLARYRKNRKAFAWTYERDGNIWVNVKADPEWRDFWRQAYESVIPGYHQNKEHWNTIILDGSVPRDVIKRMIAESYDLIVGKNEVSGRKQTK